MKKLIVFTVSAAAICVWLASDIWARGGRGGGGGRVGGGAAGIGGGGPGGLGAGGGMRPGGGAGGGYRPGGGFNPTVPRTPSLSRPSVPSMPRPSGGYGTNRIPNARPTYGNLPTPGSLPSSGLNVRPSRPNIAT